MEKKENREFFLPTLLLVTGFCFIAFALVLRTLDGVNMTSFFRIGFLAFGTGLLSGIYILIDKRTAHRSDF